MEDEEPTSCPECRQNTCCYGIKLWEGRKKVLSQRHDEMKKILRGIFEMDGHVHHCTCTLFYCTYHEE